MLEAVLLVTGFLGGWVFANGCALKPEVRRVEKKDLSFLWGTKQDDYYGYRAFIKNNEKYQKPISKSGYFKQIKDAQDYLKAHPSGKTAPDLRERIIAELNIGFLLQDLDQRALTVIVTAERLDEGFIEKELLSKDSQVGVFSVERPDEGFIEKELLFKDPQVGVFSVLFLVPGNEKKCPPAIIGLHGHGDSAQIFEDEYFGRELAQNGFAVIMPDFRSFGVPADIAMSEALYLKGFTLMGLRVYETLLLVKYLKAQGYGNIGIMGHSGGSDAAYLTSIISRDLKALVYDDLPLQLGLIDGQPHCETIPGLAYYGPQIIQEAALKTSWRKFQYGYPLAQDLREMMDFLKMQLAGKGDRGAKAAP